MAKLLQIRKRVTSFQIIILGFAAVILLGTLLLMLPFAANSGQMTPFHEALFTATSAACVTGLVVQDTASYWAPFGQTVILLLIQVGGMGVVTIAVSFARLSGRKVNLRLRSTMQEAVAAPQTGGMVRLTGFILKATLLFELLGAAVMAPVFCRDFGVRGIWLSLFHSVSAFCNAGFDLMGSGQARFVSLTGYSQSPVINITIMLLIVIGGIGFLTWDDVRQNRFHFRRYRMQSKVILVTTGALLLLAFLYFFFFEFGAMPAGERIFGALFQSVTPRTAGFNTVDLRKLTETGKCVLIVLMLIGGSPGSTAGGMKTTTVAVLFANAMSVIRRKGDVHFFGRRIKDGVVKHAATIFLMYLTLFVGGAFLISLAEGLPIGKCLFETASAIGTVGLTLGITPQLGVLSQLVLVVLMFWGRVGGLTLIYAALSGKMAGLSRLPEEKIIVG